METRELLDALGYTGSANCLTDQALQFAPDYGHVFRRASDGAGLEAVYCLRQPRTEASPAEVIPVTYVCRASSYEQADEIHRLVWNQNVVPFLIVLAPHGVRVYTGFERQEGAGKRQHLLESDLAGVASRLAVMSAASIDSGGIWDHLGERARPRRRVEWRLLHDLEGLEKILIAEGLQEPSLVHTLIGKLLYLHYLRHRGILSDVRLARWDLTWPEVATRGARLKSFLRLCAHLDDWLNGSVFPLTTRMMSSIGADHLQRAAGVFAGDSPEGQQHLAFDAYDFSYIPIETLSVVYEQFLHARKAPSGPTVGRQRGAYYTPLPVVNFIIDRMDDVKPLRAGMRVLDPACGSGAFLVQCYRKLIEDRLRSAGSKLRPPELRELLVRHVFGIDVDAEACRVAELSLLLTMLDYIDPPDLTNTTFKLPDLSATNIIEANAFDDGHEFLASAKARGFDWIIGNPPWNEIAAETTDPVDKRVLDWINAHRNDNPTGGNQAAEAFLWRARDLAQPDGVAGFLVPAMTLFKTESRAFRERFFRETRLTYAANFSNLAEVLFAGRSRVPAAALIFRPSAGEAGKVPVFSPLVANQEPTRPRTESTRVDTWSLVVDENELRFVDQRDVAGGDSLVWKLAAWGSELDRAILRRTASLGSLGDLAANAELTITEGMQLRKEPTKDSEPVEHHPEVAGKLTVELEAMTGCRLLFAFPENAWTRIPPELAWVRAGRYSLPEKVSRPPHIVVNAARNWAIFSNEYIVVPPRQIGIAGTSSHADLLKALTLYLNSHFVQYHQFFAATQAGVKREVGTLRALRTLPIPTPLGEQEQSTIESWARLHDELRACDASAVALDERKREAQKAVLLVKANTAVNAALRLREQDRIRISDFVDVVLGLRDGKVEERAVREPEPQELRAYADRLRRELDAFIGRETGVSHGISIWRDNREGIIQIELAGRDGDVTVHPPAQSVAVMKQVATIRSALAREFSQWRYFNRNLRIFSDERVYLFKPLQRFHWLESQAIQDAGEVVALVLHRVPAPA